MVGDGGRRSVPVIVFSSKSLRKKLQSLTENNQFFLCRLELRLAGLEHCQFWLFGFESTSGQNSGKFRPNTSRSTPEESRNPDTAGTSYKGNRSTLN